jgi:hypothetical protein
LKQSRRKIRTESLFFETIELLFETISGRLAGEGNGEGTVGRLGPPSGRLQETGPHEGGRDQRLAPRKRNGAPPHAGCNIKIGRLLRKAAAQDRAPIAICCPLAILAFVSSNLGLPLMQTLWAPGIHAHVYIPSSATAQRRLYSIASLPLPLTVHPASYNHLFVAYQPSYLVKSPFWWPILVVAY